MTPSRSTAEMESIQELLDSETSAKHATLAYANQYLTPQWLVDKCNLPQPAYPSSVIDPQCGEGALIKHGDWRTQRFGCDIDNRIFIPSADIIKANCVKVFAILEELFPNIVFECGNANPPFGKKWAKEHGGSIDSTLWTWETLIRKSTYGYFIANANTIEELGINDHPFVVSYECHAGKDLWKGMRDGLRIGVVHWKNSLEASSSRDIQKAWEAVGEIIEEEKVKRPPFNIYLDKSGYLKTYLSQRSEIKLKLERATILKLHRVNECHPLTLTTERETRALMKSLIDCGVYNIEPAAKSSIESALREVEALACPIMPVTPFETVAYCDEEDTLTCKKSVNLPNLCLTAGKAYEISTGTYRFTERFTRKKVHFDEGSGATYSAEHDCSRTGQDRYVTVKDDNLRHPRFMDKPRKDVLYEFDESLLWEYFEPPKVKTLLDVAPLKYGQNVCILKSIEMLTGMKFYEGQLEYLAKVGVKDSAVIAADTGTGKSLMAISLLAIKSPARSLIIAPQGTMRSPEGDDEDGEEYSCSQWLEEIRRFAPYLDVYELFSYEDYERLLSLHKGVLPAGVYVTYYEAFFRNGARENTPDTWVDTRLNKYAASLGLAELPPIEEVSGVAAERYWCNTVGKEVNGIRCILEPSLATKVGHLFDAIMLDESHVCCNLGAQITQALIRLQPKYRFAFSATPIPNVVSNLFSIMGWVAVPGWFKGGVRNAAWPYARDEIGRFTDTFMSVERDHTSEAMKRKTDPRWKGSCVKTSPVISSPARLLKLLKPNMAFISKEQCRADYKPPKFIDVRVPMGLEQAKLYAYYLDRGHIPAKHPLIRARKQTAWLRNICADPAGFRHGGPAVGSNMNPKTLSVLELVRDILAEGEQVVIVSARLGQSDTLQHKLAEAGVPIARIDSTIPDKAAQANLFKSGKARVMIMGIKCAASYSFDRCKYEIVGSLEFSYGPLHQAAGRVDRVTSRPGVTIYCILHKDTSEEIMYDTCASKGDAAAICLRGQRVPRDFKPIDASEVLAASIDRFDLSGKTPEHECEAQWPLLRDAIKNNVLTSRYVAVD